MTTKAEIRGWLEEGRRSGATHVMVVCDTYEYDDYPVYVGPHESPRDVYARYHEKNMQKVMEVYCMEMDLDTQLAEHRALHFEATT